MSACGGSMEPIGSFQRRFNRIAADDDFDLVLALPSLPPLTSSDVKAQRLEGEVGEESDKPQVA